MNLLEEWKHLLDNTDQFYIFGTGKVGLKLYELACMMGYDDRVLGFVVSKKTEESVQGKTVFEPKEIEDDTVPVLVSVAELYHPEVFDLLKGYFRQIIPAHRYYLLEPDEGEAVPMGDVFMDIDLPPEKEEARKEIADDYFRSKHVFGNGGFYQSLPMLGIRGMRPTEERFKTYRVMDFLNSDSKVLDIGCNCGFLDMELASKIRWITGVEYNDQLSAFSTRTAKRLAIENISFFSGDFGEWYRSRENKDERYSALFSFAVHQWLQMTPDEYADVVNMLLEPEGYLFFESHEIASDNRFDDFCGEFERRSFKPVHQGSINDDKIHQRKFVVYQKRI